LPVPTCAIAVFLPEIFHEPHPRQSAPARAFCFCGYGRQGRFLPPASLNAAIYCAAAAIGAAAVAAGRFALRKVPTWRSAIVICSGFAFHG